MNFRRHWWVFFSPFCFLQGVVNNHVNYRTLTYELDLLKISFWVRTHAELHWGYQSFIHVVDDAEQAMMFHSTFYIFQSVFTQCQHGSVLQIVSFLFCFVLFFSFTTGVAEPKVCFLQTLNAEPIQIVVTHSLIFSPKLRTSHSHHV